MERLNGMDASFLYMETPTSHMHVTGVIVVDPSTAKGEYGIERVIHLLESRLHLMPQFRRRVLSVPLGIDHPVWIEDPDFDLRNHVHRTTLRPPGSRHELAELVADIASRPLDRARPLWEMWVADGGEDGTVALVSKMHHCAIDGVTGADLMSSLFDLEPDAPDPDPPEQPWQPDTVPTETQLAADALVGRAMDPAKNVRAALRTGRTLAGAVGSFVNRNPEGPSPALPFTAPSVPWTKSISSHRVVAFGQAELDDLKAIKVAYDCKINDVVLAACTRSLREYLLHHGGVPDQPLISMVPVSVHGQGDDTSGTNQVSSMAVRLPVHLESPVDQVLDIREDTKAAKEMQNAIGADMLRDFTQFMPPVLFNQAMRLYSRTGLASRHRPIQNLVISNVPGPPIPLYTAGARVVAVYPFGPLIEGAGMNITVLSNMGNMDMGVIADPELVPDVWDIAEGFGAAVKELKKAADAV